MIGRRCPEAGEAISYQMPTFVWDGYLVHFAAFNKDIGLYPPVRGDETLNAESRPIAARRGTVSFPSTSRSPTH